jgi:hypothetical protein
LTELEQLFEFLDDIIPEEDDEDDEDVPRRSKKRYAAK